MEFKTLRSMWGAPTSLDTTIRQTVEAGFDGIEGPVPEDAKRRGDLRRRLDDAGLLWIAEVTTGLRPGSSDDWWVPAPDATVEDHLSDLRRGAEAAADLGALFVSTMCGYDAWSWPQNLEFFSRGLDIERDTGVAICFETHRCRSLFNPWITRDLLQALPDTRLTCDFSHWCVVAERVVDTERAIIDLCASRAGHVHGRVGNAQAAQVADPRDPRHVRALASHEAWWSAIWDAQEARGMAVSTMNIEWGPDGYTPHLPFTDVPVVDRWDVICWMQDRQRERFAQRSRTGLADPLTTTLQA